MTDNATVDDKRFIFLKDIDGNDAPIYIGSIVRAINSGAVPGFAALNEQEQHFAEEILRDAEHHHRFRMLHDKNAAENFRSEGRIERMMVALRKRLNMPIHRENVECCRYLREKMVSAERFGI